MAELLTAVVGDVWPRAGGGVPDRPEAGAGGQPPGLPLPPGAQGAGANSEKVSGELECRATSDTETKHRRVLINPISRKGVGDSANIEPR